MAGKAYAVLYIDGTPYPAYASHSGGQQNPNMRDVPLSNLPNTMRSEPTGGVTYVNLELSFQEKQDEGIFIDPLVVFFQTWQRDPDEVSRRKAVTVSWYKDIGFTQLMGSLDIAGAYPVTVTPPDGERGSEDAREFSVELTHLGSAYKSA